MIKLNLEIQKAVSELANKKGQEQTDAINDLIKKLNLRDSLLQAEVALPPPPPPKKLTSIDNATLQKYENIVPRTGENSYMAPRLLEVNGRMVFVRGAVYKALCEAEEEAARPIIILEAEDSD